MFTIGAPFLAIVLSNFLGTSRTLLLGVVKSIGLTVGSAIVGSAGALVAAILTLTMFSTELDVAMLALHLR